MIGPRLFRSRWAALLWAGGILWTAYNAASSEPGTPSKPGTGDAVDATGVAVDANDLAALANLGSAQ